MNKFAEALLPGDTFQGHTVYSVRNGFTAPRGGKVTEVVIDRGVGALPRFETFYPMALAIVPQI